MTMLKVFVSSAIIFLPIVPAFSSGTSANLSGSDAFYISKALSGVSKRDLEYCNVYLEYTESGPIVYIGKSHEVVKIDREIIVSKDPRCVARTLYLNRSGEVGKITSPK